MQQRLYLPGNQITNSVFQRIYCNFGMVQVARLAMLSLLAVFKDILPGYRIRLPTEKELEIPVSKEVKQTRDYEAMQLKLYQASNHICDAVHAFLCYQLFVAFCL